MTTLELFERHTGNPILTAGDWPYPVNAVFNPAAAACNGETVLLARVEDRRGISHLTVARSANGVDGWTVEPEPLLAPADGIESEQWGFEDARVVWVEELGRWVITCTAYGPAGPAVFLATTEDFDTVERHGVVSTLRTRTPRSCRAGSTAAGCCSTAPRPSSAAGTARSFFPARTTSSAGVLPNRCSNHAPARGGTRYGSASDRPPLPTEHGWLLVYHGVKDTVAGDMYRVGLALLDLDEPTRVLRRLPTWVLAPLADYERTGDVPNVVFPSGLLHDEASDEIRLYYGAADSSICLATARLRDLLDAVLAAPVAEVVGHAGRRGSPRDCSRYRR